MDYNYILLSISSFHTFFAQDSYLNANNEQCTNIHRLASLYSSRFYYYYPVLAYLITFIQRHVSVCDHSETTQHFFFETLKYQFESLNCGYSFFILVTINCYFQNLNWIPVSLNIIKLDSRRCIPRTTPGPSWWWLFAALLSTALQQHLDVDFYSWGASIAKLLAFIRRSSSLLSSVQIFWWLTNRCRKDQSFVQMNIGLSPHLKFSRINKKTFLLQYHE